MRTETLIDTLVADAERSPFPRLPGWMPVTALAFLLAALVFFFSIGVRPDFVQSLGSIRFDFKFVVTGAMAATALYAMRAAARPGPALRPRLLWLALPAALLVLAVLLELNVLPPELWMPRMLGHNSLVCLVSIPSIGAPALIVFVWALSRQAPPAPVATGALAGLAAAALAAMLYASHCVDDSPLFVVVWYPLASLILVVAGAYAGHRLLRW